MLERGSCKEVLVPDGTVYHLMNYRRKGQHGIGVDEVKRHGHDTAATRCEVSTVSGVVTVDYYQGSVQHCNNIGVILPGYEDLVWTCPLDDSTMLLDDSTYVPSMYQGQSCCCSIGDGLYLPSAYFEVLNANPNQLQPQLRLGTTTVDKGKPNEEHISESPPLWWHWPCGSVGGVRKHYVRRKVR
jgi:hypothetical protein